MSAVELLAFGSQADPIAQTEAPLQYANASNGTATPVSVSAHSVLRLDLDVRANQGANPEARIYFDTGPTAAGPWTTLLERHVTAQRWPIGTARVILDGFDSYVRVRWTAKAYGPGSLDFALGVAGEGIPDAP